MRRAGALFLLLALLPACSDDGGGGSEPETAEAGLIVGQQTTGGELEDALVVVDPEDGTAESVDVEQAEVPLGVAAGPGQALYSAAEGLVLLDAGAGELQDLDVEPGAVDPALSQLATEGGGERFMVLLSTVGQPTYLLELDSGDLIELAEGRTVSGAEFTADEDLVLLNTIDGPLLVPTDDPEAAEELGDGVGQLTDDGRWVLLTSTDGVRLQSLDGEDEVVVSEEGTGALAVGDKVLLVRSDEAVLLEPGSDEVLASAPYTAGPAAPIAVNGTVLLPAGQGGGWTLIDAEAATATHLDQLDGMRSAVGPFAPGRWVPFAAVAGDDRTVVAVDTDDGSVVTVDELPVDQEISAFFAQVGPWALAYVNRPGNGGVGLVNLDTGTYQDLGQRVQGAALSPDGEQVAWSAGEAGELHVAPTEDVTADEVVTEGVALPIWLST